MAALAAGPVALGAAGGVSAVPASQAEARRCRSEPLAPLRKPPAPSRAPSTGPPPPSGYRGISSCSAPGRPPPAPVGARRPSSARAAARPPKPTAMPDGSHGNESQSAGTRRRGVSLPPLRQAKSQEDAAAAVPAPPRRPPPGTSREHPGTTSRTSKRSSSSSAPPASSAAGSQQSTSSCAKGLEEWKKRRGVPNEAKVFNITGAFPGIRRALLDRGWVENEDRNSPYWDLKYALWQRDIGDLNALDDRQAVNYFMRNSELTSKAGLCNSLYNCCTLDRPNMSIDAFFPRCYDLTSAVQVEDFVRDFKATKSLCLLHRFVDDGGRTAEGSGSGFPRAAVAAALSACQRRASAVDDEMLDEAPHPVVSDEEWQVIDPWSLKKPGKRLPPWGNGKAAASTVAGQTSADTAAQQVPGADDGTEAGDTDEPAAAPEAESDDDDVAPTGKPQQTTLCREDEAMLTASREVLNVLHGRLPQFSMDGHQNVWMLKPAGKSRGRGIQLSARLEKILEVGVGRGIEARWIAQKYIEDPMIVRAKKFDIRQWVVVTRWNPLAAWFYEDCYCRFSFADYDPSKLKNKYAHLTNNSISKKADGFEEECDDTMWSSDEFAEHLASLGLERDGRVLEDPWTEIVQPRMKQIVLATLESAQDAVQPRAGSFELFGYDFMVSSDLSVWLIEINSSPDLSYSTSTTRTLVKAMLEDMMKVVVDAEQFGSRLDRPKRKWDKTKINTGRYELLEPLRRRREEKFGRLRKDAMSLAVHGTGVKLRKPKRGECPRGPDAEDDPSISAAAILAAAQEAAGGDEAAQAPTGDNAEGVSEEEDSEDSG
eukprot:gnl/TRDRNA2_/TRDRNA2_186258_c0_seq1.p1 gnl/TRDRNA2_/TRDRNA2_186258_c0~~gnl/TRDRNA2_/TRDRNA2_186258_c0_seq1.p1  ORF type:complete len:824 (-),score=179.33 gnl/TRDRNA2_/TRDRNA2_186258_c0_seq1:59-2530(-)